VTLNVFSRSLKVEIGNQTNVNSKCASPLCAFVQCKREIFLTFYLLFPQKRGNVFTSIGLCVCLSVCLWRR